MNNKNEDEMNIQEKEILGFLRENSFENQRHLADAVGYSLGVINRSLKHLMQMDYLSDEAEPTETARYMLQEMKPKRAVILAAGAGMRMVPINTGATKGMLKVRGEILIERLIRQLHEAGIREIYIVVGFLKEQYEYLIDEYQVQLLVNPNYGTMNNLYSLALAKERLANAYILPCDIWCEKNPFRKYELYSWYMVSEEEEKHSDVRMNRKYELVRCGRKENGNRMIGIAYLQEPESGYVKRQIKGMTENGEHTDSFWEETLWKDEVMVTAARPVSAGETFEINTYEQLRELDSDSGDLDSDILRLAAQALEVGTEEIADITVLKKGMTNRSFRFCCKGKRGFREKVRIN